MAEAAEQARAELDQRGPARWEVAKSEARSDAAAAEVGAEVSAEIEQLELNAGKPQADVDRAAEVGPGAEPWPKAQATMEANVDHDTLSVMATVNADLAAADTTFDDSLARDQAAAERLAEQRACDQAERDRPARHRLAAGTVPSSLAPCLAPGREGPCFA